MKILFISCSNVFHKKEDSISTRVCELAAKLVRQQREEILTETLRLAEYKLVNCIFCGRCMDEQQCAYDGGFNTLYPKLCESDAIVFVIPFYSVVPSKLTMLLEKLNQLYYTGWIKHSQAKFSLSGKRCAIIAHGGSILHDNPAAISNYIELLLKPLNYSLQSLGCEMVGTDDREVKGAIFGVTGYGKNPASIFPDMLHDWDEIEKIIAPLVTRVIA
jgi:multimeric flavodoxin WrbA